MRLLPPSAPRSDPSPSGLSTWPGLAAERLWVAGPEALDSPGSASRSLEDPALATHITHPTPAAGLVSFWDRRSGRRAATARERHRQAAPLRSRLAPRYLK